jgi:hypothetical protein
MLTDQLCQSLCRRVRMNTMANSDAIAVRLQKICINSHARHCTRHAPVVVPSRTARHISLRVESCASRSAMASLDATTLTWGFRDRWSSSGMRAVCQRMVAQPLAGAGTVERPQRVERGQSGGRLAERMLWEICLLQGDGVNQLLPTKCRNRGTPMNIDAATGAVGAAIVTAVATIVVAWFTVVLSRTGRLQTRLTTIVEAPIPAIAAMKLVAYADAAGPSTIDPVPPGLIPVFCRVLPQIHNLGRTPVAITTASIKWVVQEALPPHPNYNPSIPLQLRLPPNTGIWLRLDPGGDLQLTADENERIRLRRADIWIYGYFTYLHLLGETYRVGFLARWDMTTGLYLEARPNYVYEIKE